MSHFSVPQVCVSSKQDGDVFWCLSHALHDQAQLFHPLLCVTFTALQVGRHQTQLLTSEVHLIQTLKQSQYIGQEVCRENQLECFKMLTKPSDGHT